MGKNYYPKRRTFTDNYIGQVGPVVQGKGENFSVTFRNSTGESKKIALFYGVLLSLLARNTIWQNHLKEPDNPDSFEYATLTAIGGERVPASDTQKNAIESEIIMFDDPTLLKRFHQEIACVWNDGINSIAQGIAGNVLYYDANGYVSQETNLVSVNALQAAIGNIPMIVNEIKATANDENVINDAYLYYKDLESVKESGAEKFLFSSFINEDQYNAKKATINTLKKFNKIIQLDHRSLLVLELPGISGGTAQMTLDFNVTTIKDIAKLSIESAVRQMTGTVPTLAK